MLVARRRVMVGARWPDVEMPIVKGRERTDFNRKVRREKVKISKEKLKESRDFNRKVKRK